MVAGPGALGRYRRDGAPPRRAVARTLPCVLIGAAVRRVRAQRDPYADNATALIARIT
ncbi:hypothetical protein [Streptomyces sp. NPDC055632]